MFAGPPVNVPLIPAEAGVDLGVGVETGAGVVALGVGTFFFFFVVVFFVTVFALVAIGVGVGVDLVVGVEVVVVGGTTVDAGLEVPLGITNPPDDPNCGGVIDRTAPSPPTVPPAINKKRLPIISQSLYRTT